MKGTSDLARRLVVQRDSPVPLYHQVAEQLEEEIRSGRLAAGDRIENELSLVERSGLSRPTIRQAIDVLVRKGLLSRRRGVGTVVLKAPLSRRMNLSSLYEDLEASGRSPSTTVLAYRPVKRNDPVPRVFAETEPDRLFYIERLRTVEDGPLALMQNWMPIELIGFSKGELEAASLSSLLRAVGRSPKTAKQRFSAVAADARQAGLLEVDVACPLLFMSRTAFDADGRSIEYAEHFYVGDSYAVEVSVSAE